MALTDGQKLAVYLLLSHPYSAVRKSLDFLTPRPTLDAAATDVVDLLNSVLKLDMAAGSAQYTDLKGLFSTDDIILKDPRTGNFRITSDPGTLLALDDYDPSSGCPNGDQGSHIFAKLA